MMMTLADSQWLFKRASLGAPSIQHKKSARPTLPSRSKSIWPSTARSSVVETSVSGQLQQNSST